MNWNNPRELIPCLLQSKEIRWLAKDYYSAHGIAVKKIWFNRILVKGSGKIHKVHFKRVTDFIP